MQFHTTKVDSIHVRYTDTGNNNINLPIVLIHGLGGSIESWINNIDGLSKDLRVIALDLPGFGYSDKPRLDYSINFYSKFIARFLDTMGIRHAFLAGSSLGGHIAAEVAIKNPNLVSKLILISPAGALPRSFKGTPALGKYVKVVEAKSVSEVKKALYAVDGKNADHAYAKAVYEKISMPGAKEAFISALVGSARAPRLNRRLGKIRSDTLLLWGKEDQMIPVKFIEPFIKMKNCRIVLLENCGHRPHVDRPSVFNRIVTDFVTTKE